MKTMIVNGINDKDLLEYEQKLENSFKGRLDVDYFKLRDMKINFCLGCWDCWVKTPGICRIKDDYEQIIKSLTQVEEITIVAPIVAGFESYLIKTFKDRMIPMVMPYIEEYQGEQHHLQRYENLKHKLKLVLLKGPDTSDRHIEIIRDYYKRFVLNFHAELKGVEIICH